MADKFFTIDLEFCFGFGGHATQIRLTGEQLRTLAIEGKLKLSFSIEVADTLLDQDNPLAGTDLMAASPKAAGKASKQALITPPKLNS